jgi:hypothetical protein
MKMKHLHFPFNPKNPSNTPYDIITIIVQAVAVAAVMQQSGTKKTLLLFGSLLPFHSPSFFLINGNTNLFSLLLLKVWLRLYVELKCRTAHGHRMDWHIPFIHSFRMLIYFLCNPKPTQNASVHKTSSSSSWIMYIVKLRPSHWMSWCRSRLLCRKRLCSCSTTKWSTSLGQSGWSDPSRHLTTKKDSFSLSLSFHTSLSSSVYEEDRTINYTIQFKAPLTRWINPNQSRPIHHSTRQMPVWRNTTLFTSLYPYRLCRQSV